MNYPNKKPKISNIKYNNLLINKPGRSLHRLGTFLGGFWIASSLLRIIWPEPDQISSRSILYSQIEKIKPPKNTISILLLGVNYKNKNEMYENKYLQKGENDLASISLIVLRKTSPIEIVDIPVNLPVSVTRGNSKKTLEDSFKIGGIALVNDFIFKILNLPDEMPKRYISGKQNSILNFREKINLKPTREINNETKELTDSKKIKYILSEHTILDNNSHNSTKSISKVNTTKEDININSLTKKSIHLFETNLSFKEFLSVNSVLLNKRNPRYYKKLDSIIETH